MDSDAEGTISFSEFFAFIIMIKRLTPRITELYHKERATLKIQSVTKMFITKRRFHGKLERGMAIRRGDYDDDIDDLEFVKNEAFIKNNSQLIVERLQMRIRALEGQGKPKGRGMSFFKDDDPHGENKKGRRKSLDVAAEVTTLRAENEQLKQELKLMQAGGQGGGVLPGSGAGLDGLSGRARGGEGPLRPRARRGPACAATLD